MSARKFLDSIEPNFTKGGKLEKYYGLYEMVDTFIYTPADVTRGTTHVRDGNDLKRTMTFVVIATFFCILMAVYNTGYQANIAMAELHLDKIPNWRSIPMHHYTGNRRYLGSHICNGSWSRSQRRLFSLVNVVHTDYATRYAFMAGRFGYFFRCCDR